MFFQPHSKRPHLMQEALPPVAASLPPDHFNGLMQSIPYWVKAVVAGASSALFSAVGFLFYRTEMTSQRVVELRNRHDEDMAKFFKGCAERHEREFTRSTDFVTKRDLAHVENNLKDEMKTGFESIKDLIDMAIRK